MEAQKATEAAKEKDEIRAASKSLTQSSKYDLF
jgi:hypothetical protein